MFRYLKNTATLVGAILGVALARPAWALQPLDVFIQGAASHNTDAMEAKANVDAQDAQALVALGRMLPGVALKGTYTRNQYLVQFAFPTGATTPPELLTVQPQNQGDGTINVSVPLVDVASFVRYGAALRTADSTETQRQATALRVQGAVTQTYYQLVADAALVDAAQHALSVAKASLDLTQERLKAGRAAPLDQARAEAEVERQVQQLEAAQLQVSMAARALETQSGIAPELNQYAALNDDLKIEQPVETFMRDDGKLPSLHAAIQSREAAERQALAAKLQLIPALNGAFTERFTNASAFAGGHTSYYLAAVNIVWNFDVTTVGNIQAADAAVVAGQARELRARLAAHDDIQNTWNMVQSNIARSRSARAQAKASADASEWAKDRYSAGVATQLDLLTAQRDAFQAEASRIQADADLVNARAQLRYAAGIRFEDFHEEKKP